MVNIYLGLYSLNLVWALNTHKREHTHMTYNTYQVDETGVPRENHQQSVL